MSEREGGGGAVGAFLLGIAVGAVLGVLFAPEEGGASRRKLTGKLQGLRELAAEKAGDVSDLVAAARRRRRGAGHMTGGAEVADEEDETLA